jgi:hypothetical protein
MSDAAPTPETVTPFPVPAHVEEVPPGEQPAEDQTEAVSHPAKVMRIGSMIKQLLEEVRRAPLDEASRERLASIYQVSVDELASGLSEDLQEELRKLAAPFAEARENGEPPTEAELRIAQAQLVGWLEGLFHGIQATLFAQQMEARQQLEELRRRSLPAASEEVRPGTYL